jgi:ribonuclease P protein component
VAAPKYGLSAREKIKNRKEIERIFTQGEIVYSSKNKLRAHYVLRDSSDKIGVLFAVAVGKKQGNAVWRNRVKRLIREAYRLNKFELIKKCMIKNTTLEVIFSPQDINQQRNNRVGLSDIEGPLKEIIIKIRDII